MTDNLEPYNFGEEKKKRRLKRIRYNTINTVLHLVATVSIPQVSTLKIAIL